MQSSVSFTLPTVQSFKATEERRISRVLSQASIKSSRDQNDDEYALGVEENVERGNWDSYIEFKLTCLSFCTGLGNIWRFPYLCFKNGGPVFLIPCAIMLICIGVPLVFLELAIGQFSSSSALTVWRCMPLLKGIGTSNIFSNIIFAAYISMLTGWSILYVFSSFTSVLPWTNCNNTWNTPDCSEYLENIPCNESYQVKYENGTCFNDSKLIGFWKKDSYHNTTGYPRSSPAEEYFYSFTLEINNGIESLGFPRYHLVLVILLVWIITYVCLVKGVKTMGKVVYFTATFPYVILTVMLVFGAIQDGALDGVELYLSKPNWTRLAEAAVWQDAGGHVFFSLSVGGGEVIGLSSFNRFHNNMLRDGVLIVVGSALTALFAGFVVFINLGVLASQMGVNVQDVVKEGPALTFVTFPFIFTKLPFPQLWSVIFFLLLTILGCNTLFVVTESLNASVFDTFPRLRPSRAAVTIAIIAFYFGVSLPLTTPAAMYIFVLMDNYTVVWPYLIIGLLECVCIGWFYGANRLLEDIQLMVPIWRPVGIWLKLTWKLITPGIILCVLVFSVVAYSPLTYNDYVYPKWAEALGWILAAISIGTIPGVAIWGILKEEGPLLQRIRKLARPTIDWGPALVRHRKLVFYVTGFVVNPKEKSKHIPYRISDENKRRLSVLSRNSKVSLQNVLDLAPGINARPDIEIQRGISTVSTQSQQSTKSKSVSFY